MSRQHKIFIALIVLSALGFVRPPAFGQDGATGGIKGKVAADKKDVGGVAVIARQDEKEIARVETNRKGEFVLSGLAPGFYTLSFRKAGFSTKILRQPVEVRAGKTHTLDENIFLPPDPGTLVFIRGSVFRADGRVYPGVAVELERINADGKLKKIETKYTNEAGEVNFRLPKQDSRYRVTAKADGFPPVSKDVTVEGAARYSVGLTIEAEQPKQNSESKTQNPK